MNTKETLTNQEIKSLAENIIDRYLLDYNNAEVYLQEGILYMTVEAPNHATIGVDVNLNDWVLNKKVAEKIIIKAIVEQIRTFDADDEFDELWSIEFGSYNGFRASEFIRMLQEDEVFFKNCAVKMNKATVILG